MGNVIAEIGLNHGGDFSIAKRLIKQSKDAGCWGVKFQYREIESFYNNKDEVSDVIIYDEIKKNFISIDMLGSLAKFCKELDINFGVSCFRAEDVDKLDELILAIDFFKIPSAECFNVRLLKELRKRNKKIFISTGAHETKQVIKHLKDYKSEITLLHCISNYPALLGTQDLAAISYYKKSGFLNVGYSSHDSEWEVCLLALSQGANWIERHITIEKDASGLDHSSSSVSEEFVKLVRFCKGFEDIIGKSNHLPNQGELINLQNLGTCLYANRDIKVGEKTSISDYDIKAPRIGITSAEFMHNHDKSKILQRIKKGQPLSLKHFTKIERLVDPKIKSFAQNKLIGIPVRLHDYGLFRNKFDVMTYEFHLSFTEALSGDFEKTLLEIGSKENISIHLPDYIPGNRLLDPISRNNDIKEVSRQLIEKVGLFAQKIENKISKKVNIVGSFSQCHNTERTANLDEIFAYISDTNKNILPQWLPVFAWYFGGSVKLELFNSHDDIAYMRSNNCKICLDVSHLVMAASYYKASWKEWYNKLQPCVEHIHISDAASSTSEGLMFGDGIIGNFSSILSTNKLKIIECWQGHIDEGEGFKQALDILHEQSFFGKVQNV